MKARLQAALAVARSHPRHALLAALVAGLLAAPVSRPLVVCAAVAAALACGRRPLALGAAAAVLAGGVAADARLAALDRTRLAPLIGHPVDMSLALLEQPRTSRSGNSRAALARIVAGTGHGERVLLRILRRARWAPVATGRVVRVHGVLRSLGEHESYQRRRGAHATLLATAVTPTGRWRAGLAGATDRLRARVEAAIASGLPPPEGALARGMVLGEDDRLDERAKDDFRRSGLAHLVAASGQNVMLLAALALPLLGALGLGLRARLAAVLGLIALYVPLAGAGPSIQRAGVMGAVGVVAGLSGRRSSRWYALLLAAGVTLAVNPRAAGDPGWQLSFAAVVSILLLCHRIAAALRARGLAPGVADAAALTTAATIGTAPLLAFHFGRLSLVSLPANLLAAPAVGPVMWLGMAAGAIGLIAPAGAVLVNALAAYPLAYVGWLAHASASLPHASVSVRLASAAGVAGAYAAIALALASRAARRGATAVATVALAAALLGGRAPPAPAHSANALEVWFLDVGQGDATLVEHGSAAILVDTGPPGAPLLARLRHAGVRALDLLVVTHAQIDHEGNAASVLESLPVGLLLDGGADARTPEHAAIVAAAARRGVRRVVPDAGEVLRDGPLELDVLWPHREPAALHAGIDPNQRAIVARLRDGAFDLLLTADAESDVTAQLDLPAVEALKVAHHGSADPGLPDLLARIRPQIAAIEVGRHNPYGHPTAQALAALRAVPQLYRTDRDGTVRLSVAGGRMMVTTGA